MTMNFFLLLIVFTIFREINSVTIRAWNSESCCYRDESTDDLMQIDSATGIASVVGEPLVPNCEEYENTTFSCNYYMICSFSYMEAPRMDISEGDYGCKYVDNSEASCEGNAGMDGSYEYHGIKCDSLYTYPDSSGDTILIDDSRVGMFDLPSVPFASTECDMKSNVCVRCSPGYRLHDGTCVICETGHECVNGLSQVSCNIGTFSGTVGSQLCTDCGTGRYTPEVQATTCLSCSPGYEPNADRSGCDICPPTTSSSNGEACLTCEPGKYSLTSGKTSCDTSEAGTYALNGVRNSCPLGSYAVPGSSSCETCETIATSTCLETSEYLHECGLMTSFKYPPDETTCDLVSEIDFIFDGGETQVADANSLEECMSNVLAVGGT